MEGTPYEGCFQLFYDALFGARGEHRPELLRDVFEPAQLRVDAHCRSAIPGYRPDSDPYDPRWTAASAGAYVSGLVACHVHDGTAVPPALADAWYWLVDGHWPCSYDQDANRLVVL